MFLMGKKLFPYAQLKLSLLKLLHGVTCPFSVHLGEGPGPSSRGGGRLLGNLCFSWLKAPPPSASPYMVCSGPTVFSDKGKTGF